MVGHGRVRTWFQIEFWPQDPGTIAYQPLAVFDRSPGPSPVTPTARFIVEPADYTIDATPDGLTHFSLDLAAPVALAANDSSNPRWFIGVIGRTHAYATWNSSQGTGGSTRTFQWNRGDANNFRSLGDGRALVLADAGPEPLPQLNISASSNGALVSWSTNAVGFVLQENFDCASGNWANVTNAVSVVDGEYCVAVPIFPTRNNFFRLIRPRTLP